MIIKVKKFLIYGVRDLLSSFFERAQKLGCIEFIGKEKKEPRRFPPSLKKYLTAIKVLKQYEEVYKSEGYSSKICDQVVETEQDIEYLEEEKKHLEAEAKKAAAFGDFNLDDLRFIENETNLFLQFFCIKSGKKVEKSEDLIYVSTDYDLDYFVAINREKKSYRGFLEITFEKPVGVLKKAIENINIRLEEARGKLKSFAPFLEMLKKDLIDRLNDYNLEKAKNQSEELLEDRIFSVEAWVPETKVGKIENLLAEFAINYERIALEKDEVVPTYMENGNIAKMGEDLVNIYDTPSTSDKDPSIWVLGAFTLFFSMIISDAGYGLIYLAISLFLRFKVKKRGAKRFSKLVFMLSVGCILWGVLTTSFFGINFGPESSFQKVSVLSYLAEKKADYHVEKRDDVFDSWKNKYPNISEKGGKDFLISIKKENGGKVKFEAFDQFKNNILMELSLLVGILHISISFLRNFKRHIAGLGWVVFLIGGYLFFPSILKATSIIHFLNILPKQLAFSIGYYMLFSGIGLAVFLAFFQKKFAGIKEITNVVGVFGDVLSYLRLYALGIAGMILAETFNDLGSTIPIFFAIFVIVIGHSINIVLGIIGGVIHGLRLNFLEWYNHCFQGGGKLFNPLRLFK